MAININCNGSLPQAMIGEIPNAAPFVIAKYIFAGYTAINKNMIPQAAVDLYFLKNRDIPKIISKHPLIITNSYLKGKKGGTIRSYQPVFIK